MNGILWFLLSGSLIALLVFPAPKRTIKIERIKELLGYKIVQQRAEKIGFEFHVKHYIILIVIAIAIGGFVARMTNNPFIALASVVMGYSLPRIFLSTMEYKYRKDILINLPVNLRKMVARLADCKTVQLSIERSIPSMHGVTKIMFAQLLRKLELGIDLQAALEQMADQIKFQKFDDLVGKLVSSSRDGFHLKSIQGLKESIEDMQADVKLLKRLDIENKAKIAAVYSIIGGIWFIVLAFSYFESNTGGGPGTFDTVFGKIALAFMIVCTFIVLMMKDKYMRLNMNDLR
ncbi:type II secretion system F family protein [Paenibacillus bovis]|uniref:Type II secretion system protein GspF domain-containing protein n=1 Tax=Paenibacillus bovis TaxID=1616788 RepID=A0A1X9T476_9BACL|nr:hypothetical protein [Paenibacillus bovis]ARR10738.1 hypothetical protein AR543_p0130 [Paenibacillus bovis]